MKQFYFAAFVNEVFFDLVNFKNNQSISLDILIRQIYFSGYQALGLIRLIALLLGVVIIVEGHTLLGAVGQTDWIYQVLISALVRDVGPFIVSFVIIARSGTAIATELGNMVVNREYDALRVMGISPISYLVSPRVLGIAFSQLILMTYFIVIGFLGGFLVSNLFMALPFIDFIDHIASILTPADLISMTFKVVVSGFFVGVIACYQGLSVRRSYTEVPQAAIKAVGRSIVAVCIIQVIGMAAYFLVQAL